MKKIVLPLSIAIAQMFAVGAFAQASKGGEANPLEAKGAKTAAPTPAEKASGQAQRKSEGGAAAKSGNKTEFNGGDAGKAAKVAPEEKKAAAAARKASTADAVKKGETKSGEK